MVGPEERHRGEGVPVIGIAQAKPPGAIVPTGEHRAVLCQDHRVAAASRNLLGDLAVREGRHRGEGVPVIGIAQAELPAVIAPTGEHLHRGACPPGWQDRQASSCWCVVAAAVPNEPMEVEAATSSDPLIN